jgi:hypothetical protein
MATRENVPGSMVEDFWIKVAVGNVAGNVQHHAILEPWDGQAS